jgi:hypothetical protein
MTLHLPSLSWLDSTFQLQGYISLLIHLDVNDVDAIVSLPWSLAKGENCIEQGASWHEKVRKRVGEQSYGGPGVLELTRASVIQLLSYIDFFSHFPNNHP